MKLSHFVAITLLFSSAVFAQQDIELNGTTQYPLANTPKHHLYANVYTHTSPKLIRLLNMNLSEKAWKALDGHANTPAPTKTNTPISLTHQPLPRQVQLGMNQVPVLDQGPYGTCVTFSITAAIDAASKRGDYISQLCQLELGQYLENNTNGSMVSGWNGSMGHMVLNQMENFGFVTKSIEQNIGCGGLTNYPMDGTVPENQLTLSDYKRLSTSINVGWSSIMDFYQAFIDNTDREKTLMAVKEALHQGDRLTLGVLIFSPEMGVVGAVGKHIVPNDTWIITQEINEKINIHDIHGGHEMIITGYDDDAVAIDHQGVPYHGLLTLRNSWGTAAGDGGNFYMSYDYFKRLAVEVLRIRAV